MNFDDLYPTRFMKAGNLPVEKTTYTIKDIAKEQLQLDSGVEDKVVMSFEETPMQLVLAKVNAVAIKSMFGGDVRDWLGKRLTLYATTEIMPFPKRRDEPCIRVYGSPDIEAEVICEWTPPKRRKLVQKLQPTAFYYKCQKRIRDTPKEELDTLPEKINELVSSSQLTKKDGDELVALIARRR